MINCACPIDGPRFTDYCLETARLYVSLYNWYYMPLIHGPSIATHGFLPLGQLSEEVLEASHKVCKIFRNKHARKMSRIATNTDVFQRWLLYADPKISLSGEIPKMVKGPLPREALMLLHDKNIPDKSYTEDYLSSKSSDDEDL